jgi:branched-chain amino acid transport system permease protein
LAQGFSTKEESMEQILANGVYLGSQYAMIALGLTLIFALMNVLNFAHGQMYVIGGFVTYTFYGHWGVPFVLALVMSCVTLAILGALIERYLFAPVIKGSSREESTMLLAAGIAFFLDAVIFSFLAKNSAACPRLLRACSIGISG